MLLSQERESTLPVTGGEKALGSFVLQGPAGFVRAAGSVEKETGAALLVTVVFSVWKLLPAECHRDACGLVWIGKLAHLPPHPVPRNFRILLFWEWCHLCDYL